MHPSCFCSARVREGMRIHATPRHATPYSTQLHSLPELLPNTCPSSCASFVHVRSAQCTISTCILEAPTLPSGLDNSASSYAALINFYEFEPGE